MGTNRQRLFDGEAITPDLKYTSVPSSVDWRDQAGVVTPVKNQGSCGSCWAFSTAEALESHLAIATGSATPILSPQQIVSCAPNPDQCGGTGGCQGSTQPLGFAYTKTAGITTEADYPYAGTTETCQTSKIHPVAYNDGYAELERNNYTQLVTAVAEKGPVAISIAAGGWTFQLYGGGVLSGCNDYVMDHAATTPVKNQGQCGSCWAILIQQNNCLRHQRRMPDCQRCWPGCRYTEGQLPPPNDHGGG